ncbi:MAG: 5-oxoprolinase subunit PxpB [Acidobacteriota bacterium]
MPSEDYPRYFPLGDSAITVEFGNVISARINAEAIALGVYMDKHPFYGYVESVPAYASTTIFYDPMAVRSDSAPEFTTAFEAVKQKMIAAVQNLQVRDPIDLEPIAIPVDFSARAGLDLELISASSDMTVDEVITAFVDRIYRVYMLGFLPGFAYMGEVDERIATPRKSVPRKAVPKGSVGIAGLQTGIYSLTSPGGWQIVGCTDMEIFCPESDDPCLLRPGDSVLFVRN